MANTRVGGLRSVGAREAADAVQVETGNDPSVSAARHSHFKHVFQSKAHGLTVSPKKRIVTHKDGERTEEPAFTTDGARLDMVRFQDGFFATNDDELAAALRGSRYYKLDFWDYREAQAQFKNAQAAEIRRQLAADPALAAAVGVLTPTDKKDWDVAPKNAQPAVEAAVGRELTDEELERLTAPTK